MKKILLAISLIIYGFILTGCVTTQEENKVIVTTTKSYVVDIPPELLQCNVFDSYPNPEKLTDEQISDLLLELSKTNKSCAANMQKIRDFITRAKATIR